MFAKQWICLDPVDDMSSNIQVLNTSLKVLHWHFSEEISEAAIKQKLKDSDADLIGITNTTQILRDDLKGCLQ